MWRKRQRTAARYMWGRKWLDTRKALCDARCGSQRITSEESTPWRRFIRKGKCARKNAGAAYIATFADSLTNGTRRSRSCIHRKLVFQHSWTTSRRRLCSCHKYSVQYISVPVRALRSCHPVTERWYTGRGRGKRICFSATPCTALQAAHPRLLHYS